MFRASRVHEQTKLSTASTPCVFLQPTSSTLQDTCTGDSALRDSHTRFQGPNPRHAPRAWTSVDPFGRARHRTFAFSHRVLRCFLKDCEHVFCFASSAIPTQTQTTARKELFATSGHARTSVDARRGFVGNNRVHLGVPRMLHSVATQRGSVVFHRVHLVARPHLQSTQQRPESALPLTDPISGVGGSVISHLKRAHFGFWKI